MTQEEQLANIKKTMGITGTAQDGQLETILMM